jgi:ribonuclease PH
MRSDKRPADQLRDTTITPHYLEHAEGSVLIEAGKTRVICTASVEDRVPQFLRNTGKGWVTAEYGMLPRATKTRTQREASAGKVALALESLRKREVIKSIPLSDYVAAISVGIVDGEALLDLAYDDDSRAEVDMNIVKTGDGRFIEVQGTAEGTPFGRDGLTTLLDLADIGIRQLIDKQRAIVGHLNVRL